jgi:HSF-type DNA-binding
MEEEVPSWMEKEDGAIFVSSDLKDDQPIAAAAAETLIWSHRYYVESDDDHAEQTTFRRSNNLRKERFQTKAVSYQGIAEEESLHAYRGETRDTSTGSTALLRAPPRKQQGSVHRPPSNDRYSARPDGGGGGSTPTNSICSSSSHKVAHVAQWHGYNTYDGMDDDDSVLESPMIIASSAAPVASVSSEKQTNDDADDNDESGSWTMDRDDWSADRSHHSDALLEAAATNLHHHQPGSAADHNLPKFPHVLYQLLMTLEEQELGGSPFTAGFRPHGRAFAIYDTDAFVRDVMPRWFRRQSKFSSFRRQLNLYNFRLIRDGADAGSYWVRFFRNKELCL